MTIHAHQIAQITTETQADGLIAPGVLGPDRIKGLNRRGATGVIRMLGSDIGDTITVIGPVSGEVIYTASNGGAGALEYDQSGPPGAEATSLLGKIAINQTDLVADIPAGDSGRIFLRANGGAGTLSLAESSAGARCEVQDNADESLGELSFATYRRTLTARDVLGGPGGQGLIRFDPGFSAITDFTIDVLTSATNYTRIAWTGNAFIAAIGGRRVLELDNAGGATKLAAGHILQVTICGRQ